MVAWVGFICDFPCENGIPLSRIWEVCNLRPGITQATIVHKALIIRFLGYTQERWHQSCFN
jgi:hypothetical protein